ncbi:hypothetical protein N0V90_013527 [Kalmusia sp. IMI 367209]|nr:hypothetical protein N0V90_013527 [Kalmusia sp. IMI 367209]
MSTPAWIDCSPELEAECFSERSAERTRIFQDAAKRLDTKMSPSLWAFLQAADLEIVKEATHTDYTWSLVQKISSKSFCNAADALRLWRQEPELKTKGDNGPEENGPEGTEPPFTTPAPKRRHSEAFGSDASPGTRATRSAKKLGTPGGSVRRDTKVKHLCKERDSKVCAITGIGPTTIEACHIYPFSAFGSNNPNRVDRFWDVLKMFWTKDKVEAWRAKIFLHNAPHGTDTVENMITFSSLVHGFHTKCLFALRPVRMTTDKTKLELEFHWIKKQVRDPVTKVDLQEEPQSTKGLTDSTPCEWLARKEGGVVKIITSGDRFTMTTDDPVNKPLPDPGLLELQWHLQRIFAMSGAAGWTDEDFDHEDDSAPPAVPVQQWIDDTWEHRQDWGPSREGSLDYGDGE